MSQVNACLNRLSTVQVFFACKFFCILCILKIETISHLWSFVNGYNKTRVNPPRVFDRTIHHASAKKLQSDPVGLKIFCNCESSPVARGEKQKKGSCKIFACVDNSL